VSFRARGGAGDWPDLLEAAGTALAASFAPPSRRDAAFGRALGWLFGSLVLEPRFLADAGDVDRKHAPDLVRDLALRRLVDLRARAAALRIAAEVERGSFSGAAWREGYREAMSAATLAAWDGARASRDADAADQGARLSGAAAGEALRRELRERFDEDWWRNPRAGPFLAALLAAGSWAAPEGTAPSLAARALVERLE
jgi:hypothetical protein